MRDSSNLASSRAEIFPMPLLAPVTMATLPERFGISFVVNVIVLFGFWLLFFFFEFVVLVISSKSIEVESEFTEGGASEDEDWMTILYCNIC